MDVDIEVVVGSSTPRPGAGTPVVVEVRDVSAVDAPSTTVSSARVHALGGRGPVARVTLHVDDQLVRGGRALNVWARCSPSDAPRTVAGDWISTEAVPLRSTRRAQP